MSRDVLIATVTTIVFVSSIGGALWYGGYTTTLAKLASLEELLPASGPAKSDAPSADIPSHHELPPVPPAPVPPAPVGLADDSKKSSEKGSTPLDLPGVPAASTQKSAANSPVTPAGPVGDDFLAEMDLPSFNASDDSKPNPTTKPAPATVPAVQDANPSKENLPAEPSDLAALPEVSQPSATAPAEKKAEPAAGPADDLGPLPNFDELVPAMPKAAQAPTQPTSDSPTKPIANLDADEESETASPPVAAVPSKVDQPIPPVMPPLQSPAESEGRSAPPEVPSPPADPSDMADATASSLPPADRSGRSDSSDSVPIPPAPPSVDEPAAVRGAPAQTQSSRSIEEDAPSGVVARTASPSHEMPEPADGVEAEPTAPRPIPAPGREISARSQPVTTAGEPNALPRVLPKKKEASPEVAPVAGTMGGGDVVARAQPMVGGADPDRILSRAEPIARAAAPAATAAAAAASAALANAVTPAEEDYVPLHQRGNRYAPVGGKEVGQPPAEEFYAVNNLPAGSNLAYGETTVVSRKAGSGDVPQVISYDVSVYLALDGDSFESIAQTMYKSPGMGEALARFNGSRSSASASVPVGTRVRIPPANLIGGTRSRAAGESSPAAASTESSREAFKRVDRPSPSSIPNRTSAFDSRAMDLPAASPTSPGEYRSERTETLWAVAAKTLGDGRRWREIYDLNKDRLVNETQVAAGTLLRLPKGQP
jgi:hypothetical protein